MPVSFGVASGKRSLATAELGKLPTVRWAVSGVRHVVVMACRPVARWLESEGQQWGPVRVQSSLLSGQEDPIAQHDCAGLRQERGTEKGNRGEKTMCSTCVRSPRHHFLSSAALGSRRQKVGSGEVSGFKS